ncbi:unnamed protein product, partial [Mesorhabditis belari]|uniref:Interferon-related developmental regulator 1 n=1 Tax=Mesorhabditis belari TaxID=2138241 RepID=A0AAF3FCH0_9BILA
MGKGRNKNRDNENTLAFGNAPKKKDKTEDFESDSDESVSTHITFDDDLQSVRGDIDGDEETLIDTLSEHVDNATHKNIGIRTAALKHLLFGLTSRFLRDFIAKWRTTLIDIATKGLRKTDEEVLLCASLLTLVSLQAGNDVSGDIEDALAQLRVIVANPAKSEAIRAHCALCLALATFVGTDSEESTIQAVRTLRQAWAGTKSTTTSWRLFDIALSGWALLLQNCASEAFSSAVAEQPKIVSYLEANSMEIRVVAGEVLSFLYEFVDEYQEGFRFPNHNHLIEILGGLLSDSTKSKAKRDKRIQKFTLRQVYSFINGGEFPSLKIKFSTQESLELNSCSSKLLYDLCTDLLRGGMMQQLKENEFLRELFELGPPAPPVTSDERISKAHRMAVHDAASKVRNQQRGKQRDKRMNIDY